jgi:hypothetical protein
MNIATHNGTWTVVSLKTGDHRTFKISTWTKKENTPRVVSLLVGSDNESDYQSFGFVNLNGIYVWKKYRGTKFEQYARMLEKLPQHIENQLVDVHHEGRCRMCNRKLTTPESIENGIGPVCMEK